MSARTPIRVAHHCKTPRLVALAVLSAALLSGLPQGAIGATPLDAANRSPLTWTPLTPTDRRFIDDAVVDHLGGVALGKLAQQRSNDAAVKEYGRTIEREHKAAITRLVGLRPPASTPSRVAELDARQKATLARLEGLDGEQFDRLFIELVQDKHLADLQQLQQTADDRSYSDSVRELAAALAPDVRQHAQLAAQLPADERLASTPED